jgi:CRP-like cAMP-binding protein
VLFRSLFNEIDLDLLVAIGDRMNQDIYDAKEKVFDLNQRANRMYLIVQGAVELFDEKNTLITELFNEDFFGEESLFNDKPRAYMAFCKIPTLFLTLSKTNLLTVISECPSVAINLLQCYTQNIRNRQTNTAYVDSN